MKNKTLTELEICYIKQFGFDINIKGYVTGLNFLTIQRLKEIAEDIHNTSSVNNNQQPEVMACQGGGEMIVDSVKSCLLKNHSKKNDSCRGVAHSMRNPPADIYADIYETPGYPKWIKANKVKIKKSQNN